MKIKTNTSNKKKKKIKNVYCKIMLCRDNIVDT